MKKTALDLSILGFGCMRLLTRGQYDKIDEKKASQLVDRALDHGVNYLDTAYPYHGLSNSEGGSSQVFLGEYLHQRDLHSQVHLANKNSHLAVTGTRRYG